MQGRSSGREMLNKLDAAYLAGLIDGEGCIFINKSTVQRKNCGKRGFTYHSGIAVAMTSYEILHWAKRITGVGQIRTYKAKKRHKQAWRWSVWSNEATALLKNVIPFLKLKHSQAKNQIKFQSLTRWTGSFGYTKKEQKQQDHLYKANKKLNKRGR
jgi:LAGLIDADG endonuclease